jgi:hypothetical protein
MATRRKPESEPRFIPDVELIYGLIERTNRVRCALDDAGCEESLIASLTERWSVLWETVEAQGGDDVAKALRWPDGELTSHWWPLRRLEELDHVGKLQPRFWVRRPTETRRSLSLAPEGLGCVAEAGKRSGPPVAACLLVAPGKPPWGLVAFAKGPCLYEEYRRELALATVAANESHGVEDLCETLGECVVSGESSEGRSLWRCEWRLTDVLLLRVDSGGDWHAWAEWGWRAGGRRPKRAGVRVPTPAAIAFYERSDVDRLFAMLGEAVVQVELRREWSRDSVWSLVKCVRDNQGWQWHMRRGRPPYPADWRDKAAAMFQSGVSKEGIARQLDVSTWWVRKALRDEPG